MDELHQLHEAINKLWQIIKKYNDKLPDAYDEFIKESESVQFDDPAIKDLFQWWIVEYMKYKDRREK